MNNTTQLLKFSKGNSKLGKETLIFNLPAGHSCPGAKDCKTSVVENEDGKRRIEDGPHNKFRCYAATAEVIYPAVYAARKHNFDIMRPIGMDKAAMVRTILDSMATQKMNKLKRVRVHESGDYFTYSYFAAWMEVATAFPNITFYSYTKSLPFVARGQKDGIIPPNFLFTASKGGNFDHLIERHGFKSVTVTTTEQETEAAKAKGGKFDHDDSLALGSSDFFLQVHGQQPKGTEAAKYWDRLVKAKQGGYSKKNGYNGGGKVVKMDKPKPKMKKAA